MYIYQGIKWIISFSKETQSSPNTTWYVDVSLLLGIDEKSKFVQNWQKLKTHSFRIWYFISELYT